MVIYTEGKDQKTPFTSKIKKIPTCPRCNKNDRIVFRRVLTKQVDNSYVPRRVGTLYRINCECGRIGEFEKTEDKALSSFLEYEVEILGTNCCTGDGAMACSKGKPASRKIKPIRELSVKEVVLETAKRTCQFVRREK